MHAELTWRRCVARPVQLYHIKRRICRSHSDHSSLRVSNRNPSTKTRAKFDPRTIDTRMRFIPPVYFVNHPPTSTTPTVLKGQSAGLTHSPHVQANPPSTLRTRELGWNPESTHSLPTSPLTSPTPTVLKGRIVGLTHHTFYETHPHLENSRSWVEFWTACMSHEHGNAMRVLRFYVTRWLHS